MSLQGIDRCQSFGAQTAPTNLALNGRRGRRIAAILDAQGRHLEVLDIEVPPEDELMDEEFEDEEMESL